MPTRSRLASFTLLLAALAPAAQALEVVGAGAPVGAFIMLGGQQNHHFCGIQSSYVADADVVQGVHDPIMTVLSRGLSVDLEPHETIDGVLVTTRFVASIDQEWSTSPVSELAGGTLVTIQTPSQRFDESRGSRLVPHGGASLLRFGERAYALTFEVVELPGEAKAAIPAK